MGFLHFLGCPTFLQVHCYSCSPWINHMLQIKHNKRNTETGRGRLGTEKKVPGVAFCCDLFFTSVLEEEEELLSPFCQCLCRHFWQSCWGRFSGRGHRAQVVEDQTQDEN